MSGLVLYVGRRRFSDIAIIISVTEHR